MMFVVVVLVVVVDDVFVFAVAVAVPARKNGGRVPSLTTLPRFIKLSPQGR